MKTLQVLASKVNLSRRSSLELSWPIISSFVLAACASGTQPISDAGKEFSQYMAVKRELATDLERGLLQGETNQYRLVAVTGPSYPIGAVLDVDNPADILTRNCIVPAAALPQSERWAALPTWSSSKTIGLTAGLPATITAALAEASVDVSAAKTGSFGIAEISQQLVAQNDFVSTLQKEECQKAIGANDVLIVRGIVSGKETLKTQRDVKAGASVKLVTKGTYSVKYDGTGAFELNDAAVTPKFLVLTSLRGTSRGARISDSFSAPSAASITRVEELLMKPQK